MRLSTKGQNWILDRILGSGNPSTLYLALTYNEPREHHTGSDLDEPTEPSYGRAEVANGETEWPEASDGIKTNDVQIAFPKAEEDWGERGLRYFAITTQFSGGDLYVWGRIVPDRRVREGDIPTFTPGTITVRAQ